MVISMQDVPEAGQIGNIVMLGAPVVANVRLDGYGELTVDSILVDKTQALEIAMKITELVGAADFEELDNGLDRGD